MNYRAYRKYERSWYFVNGFDSLEGAIRHLLERHTDCPARIRNIRGELVWSQTPTKHEKEAL